VTERPPAPAGGFTVFPVTGIPELREGDDLAALVLERVDLHDGDVVVVAQKAISKIEGRVVRLDGVEPSERAREIAGDDGDPQRVEWILRESKRVVRVRPPLVIAETRHGFICASAGVDQSNTPEAGTLVLLPLDPDASARALRRRLLDASGRDVGVLVTDSFGRPWRQGTTDVAIGAAGIVVMRELSGERDPTGYELKATVIAVADELAGAAQLVAGKLDRVPVSIIRGLDVRGDGRATDIPIPPELDLFG
jgi:coenzyme F420-0:L-glutamate ligase/coenzyme F420-1:gamma-L-glutamate ligase